MATNQTVDELEIELGEKLKRLRLNKNLDQKTLAARAGVSVRALRNLESGTGSTTKTLLSVVRALGRESWIQTVAPVPTINPLALTVRAAQRLRATSQSVGRSSLPFIVVKSAQRLRAATASDDEQDARTAPNKKPEKR